MDAGRIMTLLEAIEENTAKLRKELTPEEPCTHPPDCQMVMVPEKEWRCDKCGEMFTAATCPHPTNALQDVSSMGNPSMRCSLCATEIGVANGEADAD